jgi:hypothetical protein
MAEWFDVTAQANWTVVLGFGSWTGSGWSSVDNYVTLRRTGTWTADYTFTKVRFSVSTSDTWELDLASVTFETQVVKPALPDTDYTLTLTAAFLEFQVVGTGSFTVTKIELYGALNVDPEPEPEVVPEIVPGTGECLGSRRLRGTKHRPLKRSMRWT